MAENSFIRYYHTKNGVSYPTEHFIKVSSTDANPGCLYITKPNGKDFGRWLSYEDLISQPEAERNQLPSTYSINSNPVPTKYPFRHKFMNNISSTMTEPTTQEQPTIGRILSQLEIIEERLNQRLAGIHERIGELGKRIGDREFQSAYKKFKAQPQEDEDETD